MIVALRVSFPYAAARFSKLQYLFNMSALTIPGRPALAPARLRLATCMKRYWTEFATFGEPNIVEGVPYWRTFDQIRRNPMQSLDEHTPRVVFQFSEIIIVTLALSDHRFDVEHKCESRKAASELGSSGHSQGPSGQTRRLRLLGVDSYRNLLGAPGIRGPGTTVGC